MTWSYLPCNFRRWNLGLPRKLFLMFVKRVFHNWLLALLQVDAVMAGDGALPAFATPRCGEFGAGPVNDIHNEIGCFDKRLQITHGSYNCYFLTLGTDL